MLVVLADQLKTPMGSADVGSMYLGAWGPSVIQIALFALYTFVLTRLKPDWLPPVPAEARTLRGWALWRKCLRGIIPCAVLIFLVLGTIMLGIATPTESGAMGAVGALVLAVIRDKAFTNIDRQIYRVGIAATLVAAAVGVFAFGSHAFRIPLAVVYLVILWLLLRAGQMTELRLLIVDAYQSTARITAMVVFILIGSTCFSVVFQGVDGGAWVEHLFTSLPGGWIGFLIVVNLFIFFLAFFLDFFEIAFIVVPMLAPVAVKVLAPVVADSMGGNPEAAATAALVWFGVMLCVNMQTSFMHPPFGFALFYLRGIAPKEVKSSDIYWGALPWVGLQMVMVIAVMFWPGMVTGLLDKGSLKHSGSAEVSIPLGGEADKATVPGPGAASAPGTLELPGASEQSEPAAPQFEFEKKN
ncbi:Sialic acid TRAP transporter permease protein SiaT [compost metagenome]